MAESHLFPELWGEDYYSGAIMTCGVRTITREIVDPNQQSFIEGLQRLMSPSRT